MGSSHVILVWENKSAICFAWLERVTSCSQHDENRATFPVLSGLMTPLMTQDGCQILYTSCKATAGQYSRKYAE